MFLKNYVYPKEKVLSLRPLAEFPKPLTPSSRLSSGLANLSQGRKSPQEGTAPSLPNPHLPKAKSMDKSF